MKAKTLIKRIGILGMVCLLAAGICACGAKKRSPGIVIEELVVYYGTYGEEAEEKEKELLKELQKSDKDAAEKWEQILDYWKYANQDIEIHYDVLPDGLPENGELCLVALGFQLNEDGSMKEELLERLKVVLASAQKYPQAHIVCTGGGTAKNNESATEAGEMAKWLEAQGIAKDRIIVEDQSITTAQNAMFTYQLLAEHCPEVTQIAIISSDYHIATGSLFFEAWNILQADEPGQVHASVVSNAAYKAPKGQLSTMFQAGGLIELSGDIDTAFDIYYEEYDIHELPPLNK